MDTIFRALADPARRVLLDSLRQTDGQTLQQLQGQLDMTRFGVMKHLGVLEEAGLIVTRKRGRYKHHYLNAVPLQQAIDRWIEPLLVKPAARAVIDLKSQLEGTQSMPKPDFVMQTFIKCTQDALWSALTQPDDVKHYHFIAAAARGRMDTVGERMVYENGGGEEIVANKVIAVDPKTRIEVSFEPSWAGPDMAHSRCVYLIEPMPDHCCLTVEHYDIPAGQEGVSDGWARTLSGLKSWLETGQDTHFGPRGEA